VLASSGLPEVKANHSTPFEQMIAAMRQRLRPTEAYLFADQLRICVGLNRAEADEYRLLKRLLQELSPSLGAPSVPRERSRREPRQAPIPIRPIRQFDVLHA
jgi:hypothetical protein